MNDGYVATYLRLSDDDVPYGYMRGSEKESVYIPNPEVAMLDVEGLTKDLVDELIEKINVYGDDRVEIKWKFNAQV